MKSLKLLARWIGGLILAGIVLVVVAFTWSYYRGDRAPDDAPMVETIDKNEDFYTAKIIASAIDLSMSSREKLMTASSNVQEGRDDQGNLVTSSKTAPGFRATTYRRDVHAKAHGCVNATFRVADNLPERFKRGVFAQPGQQYKAVIRFSSGKPQLNSDGVPDARGFAMKLENVPGKKLLDFEKEDQTQDFIMINSKVFFIRTIEEYAAFSTALGEGNAAVVKYFFPSLNPATWHAHEFVLANNSFKARPDSLLTEQYYSLSAYKLGPRESVKYSVRPCANNKPLRPAYASAPNVFTRAWRSLTLPMKALSATTMDGPEYFDYLREELDNQVKHGGACFEFLVQPQIAEKNMPIEDATVEWDEAASPFVPVATITLDAMPGETADHNDTCESLSFNPWHALPEHQPVGVMNRVRKALYQSMGAYRRTKNAEVFCRAHCDAGLEGKACGVGCFDACMKAAPQLEEPAVADLPFPAPACQAVGVASPPGPVVSTPKPAAW